ncbi:MAG: NADH-quinone oxidoreductase subunit C [Deltaproteobacteria bacterium]|nr:NADH-quinone oxidoreductase subunit C [Candidatus Tharpella aukensis]
MHPATEKLISALTELSIPVEACDFEARGYHFEIDLEADKLRSLAECMLSQEMFLVFVGGLHVKPAIEIVYQFASFERACRFVVRVPVSADNTIPTISDIYQGANWHERETRDFYGVIFTDHPNLVPLILAEEDVDLKPLLKKDEDLKESAAVRWAPHPESTSSLTLTVPVEEKPEAEKAEQG